MKSTKKYIKIRYSSVFLFSIILSLCNCTYHNVAIDDEKDKFKGVTFTKSFYKKLNNKDFNSINKLVSDTLLNMIGDTGIQKLTSYINFKLGKLIEQNEIKVTTKRIEDTNITIFYLVKVKVKYEKGIIDEVLGLKQLNNDEIKIISYNAYSDLLVKNWFSPVAWASCRKTPGF